MNTKYWARKIWPWLLIEKSCQAGLHAETKILAGPCRPSHITQPAELKFEQNASLIFLGFSVPPSRSHFHLHHEPLLLWDHQCHQEAQHHLDFSNDVWVILVTTGKICTLFPDFGLKYIFFAFSVYRTYHVTVLISGQFSNFFFYPTFKMIWKWFWKLKTDIKRNWLLYPNHKEY